MLELLGDLVRQKVLAQAQDLAQLDVGGPQQLEAPPELDGERAVAEVPPDEGPEQGCEDALEPERQAAAAGFHSARGHGR